LHWPVNGFDWWELEYRYSYVALPKKEQNASFDRTFDVTVTVFHSQGEPIISPPGLSADPPLPSEIEAPLQVIAEIPKPDEIPEPPPGLELAKVKVLNYENTLSLEDLRRQVDARLSSGTEMTVQAGPRLKVLQELFGTPHGRVALAAKWAMKPAARPSPEPLMSRRDVPLVYELVLQKANTTTWQITPWQPFAEHTCSRKPALVCVLFGRESSSDDLARELKDNPWHE
jgi:hypothetical protein